MTLKRLLAYSVLAGGTGMATAASVAGVGAQPANEPQGISLRETSTRAQGRGFFYGYGLHGGRSHRGGGFRSGK